MQLKVIHVRVAIILLHLPVRFCLDQLPELAHLPSTKHLEPEEGQGISPHPSLSTAAKSGLLQLAPAKANVEKCKRSLPSGKY